MFLTNFRFIAVSTCSVGGTLGCVLSMVRVHVFFLTSLSYTESLLLIEMFKMFSFLVVQAGGIWHVRSGSGYWISALEPT